MALAWIHGAGGNPEVPPDRHRGCGLHTLSSAGSPPGDAACGRRDAKSHAGLQGTAWVPGQILMLHVSSNLACPFISKSQPPNDAVSGNWFPLTCPPQYRDVDMCIHSFSLLGMQPFILALLSDYLLGVRTAKGLLFFMSSPFYSWMNKFLSSVFSYTYWKVAHSVSFRGYPRNFTNIFKLLKSKVNPYLDPPPNNTSSFQSLIPFIPSWILLLWCIFKSA